LTSRFTHFSAITALGLIYCGAGIVTAFAQSAAQEKDNSGTNPAQITRSLTLQNVHNRLDHGFYSNVATLRYNEPLFDGTWGLRLSAPLAFTDVTGKAVGGLSDVAAKLTWIAHLDQRQAVVFSGTGRWVGSPGVTYAWFVNSEIIIAPALIHNMSFGHERGRAQVNRTDVDFYTVYKPTGQNWWLTSDVTISRDWETKTTPMSWRVALGTNIGKLPGGGAVNLSIRPGIGFGPDKPFRWGLEAGISIVGF
jgi:hypothetical protein